jgi:hypothetical protein
MRPRQPEQGYKRLLRGVRDEEVAGSNPVTPTLVMSQNLVDTCLGTSLHSRGRPRGISRGWPSQLAERTCRSAGGLASDDADTHVNQSLMPSAPGMAVVIDHSRALTAAPVIVFERGGRQKRLSGSVNISSVFDAEDHDFPLELVDSTMLLVEQLPASGAEPVGAISTILNSPISCPPMSAWNGGT